jgi:hypothetical protein
MKIRAISIVVIPGLRASHASGNDDRDEVGGETGHNEKARSFGLAAPGVRALGNVDPS